MSLMQTTGRALRAIWHALDLLRRSLLNLLLLALLAGAAWAAWRLAAPVPALQPKTALVIDLAGSLVEQRSVSSLRGTALQRLRGRDDEDSQIRLRDLLAALDAAAKDPAITHALLLPESLAGAGLTKLREVAAALERFKAAGKPVIAWAGGYGQGGYFLAAHASQVWLHPMGDVSLRGYGRPRSYYKDLLDRVGVQPNVIRAGKFKNAGESFAASGPSPETLEAEGALYGALWQSWTGSVERARKLPAGSVQQAIDALPASLVAEGGDGARWALQHKWVDALKTADEMRAALIERGAATEDGKQFRQIGLGAYLARVQPASGRDVVAVVVAQGSITDGRAGPGAIGGLSTGELIRQAREDTSVKALVLRVDSPGGSAFGSELVRHELELTRQAGKPVVVSMGDLAASGGYWISTAADEVIADEATITGSIGVVAMLPTARGLADKLGVHTGGSTTTWLGAAYDLRGGMDPRFAQLVQAGVDHIYRQFTQHAAQARKRTPEQIDAVAQGRVWAGRDALAHGLVDRLGSYRDALKAAAQRAKLEDRDYRVAYLEAQPGRWARLLRRLGVELDIAAEPTPEMSGLLMTLGLGGPALAQAAQDLGWLAELAAQRKPYAALVHCLCEAP
jgi:protease-4